MIVGAVQYLPMTRLVKTGDAILPLLLGPPLRIKSGLDLQSDGEARYHTMRCSSSTRGEDETVNPWC